MDHLEVRDHLWVLLVQESREGLVRQHGQEEHIEVLQGNPRSVLVVLVQESIEVLLA